MKLLFYSYNDKTENNQKYYMKMILKFVNVYQQ